MNKRKRQIERLTTATFRTYFDGKYHKIVLKPGESKELYYSRPTEEGYGYAHEKYFHNGEEIELQCDSGGRDCDGRIDYHTDYICPIYKLHAVYNDYAKRYQPAWEETKSYQRDYSAERMGY